MSFKICRKRITNKIISVTEKKRTFEIQNKTKQAFNQVKVDGCLFPKGSADKRCDYFFERVINQKKKEKIVEVLYVELKGQNIRKAIEQLEATIIFSRKEHKGCEKNCFIVVSKVVPRIRPQIQKMKVKMKKKHQAALKIESQKLILTVD